jgi:hypothetical protein
MVTPGSYSETINHFSVLRTIEDMYGLTYAGASATATPITDVWRPVSVSQLVVSAPPATTAGAPFSITVTARDSTGKTVTGYLGTVHFTSSDPQAILPASYTFTASDAGVHTFTGGATLKTAGPQTIAATDQATPSITGAQSGIAVAPAAASQIVISGPSMGTAGLGFSITITALDPYNNRATGYVGTVHFTQPKHKLKVVLPADYTFTASDAGMHIFTSAVIFKTTGAQTISVTDTAAPGLTASLAGIRIKARRKRK